MHALHGGKNLTPVCACIKSIFQGFFAKNHIIKPHHTFPLATTTSHGQVKFTDGVANIIDIGPCNLRGMACMQTASVVCFVNLHFKIRLLAPVMDMYK